ncbi:MAG TPA: DUF99 family protein [Candidatus Acidoferrales bacterium]|nr:DUF99 family protein [Candidatus Acidoferrales bacterium]
MESKKFRVIKPEIRILGVDDGKFAPRTEGHVIVVGVVFRGGCSIDGVMHTHVEIDGFDATERLTSMINNSPHCKQLRLIMLNGITFAGFNVVDIKKLSAGTELPVIAITLEKPDLEAVHKALSHLPNADERWNTVLSAGKIRETRCRRKKLYLELAGISLADAKEIIDLTSTNSSFPEPLRVAHLIASGVSL